MAIREASPLGHHSTLPSGGRVPWVCQENGPPEPPKPRLLDRVRHAIETRHYSRRTEKAYVHWTKRYIFFHGKRHAAEMGAAEVGTTDDLHPRSQPGPSGGAEPGRPNVPVMDLDRPDYYAPGTDQISREGAPYIIARGHGGVLQGSGRIGVHRLKRIHSR